MTFQPWQYIAARLEYNFLNDANEAVRDDEELVSIAVQNKSSIGYLLVAYLAQVTGCEITLILL
jgi:hypothetical protein